MPRPLIVIVIPYLERGGTERHAAHLINALHNRFDFILLAPDGPARQFFQTGVKHLTFKRFDHSLLQGISEFKKGLLQIVREANTAPILIHIHAAPELLILSKILYPKLSCLFTVHGYHGPSLNFDYSWVALTTNILAKKVICISEAERQKLLTKGLRQNKLTIISNGIPDGLSQIQLSIDDFKGLSPDLPLIGCVSRLEKPKGIEYLIHASNILMERGLKIQLMIVGGGSDEARLKEIAGRYPEVSIVFTGPVNDATPYYKLFSFFVQPSLTEPQGITAIEAMRMGLAVIASRVGGLADLVINGETGYLVNAGDPSSLADAIAELVLNPELRAQMGFAGRKRFLTYYTIETMAQATAKVYNELIK